MRRGSRRSSCCSPAAPARATAPSVETGTIVGEVGDPRNRARVHTDLAAAYYERGSMAIALEELRVAAAADASYPPAHGMLGLVYMELQREPARRGELRARAAPRAERSRHQPQLRLVPVQHQPREGIDQATSCRRSAIRSTRRRGARIRRPASAACAAATPRTPRSSSSARSSSSPTTRRSLLQARRDPLPPGPGRRGAPAGVALQQARSRRRAESLWLALRIERKLRRARRRAEPRQPAAPALSRPRPSTRRCSGASMTEAGRQRRRRRAGARAEERGLALTDVAQQLKFARAAARGARAGALRGAARRHLRARHGARLRPACSRSTPSRCCGRLADRFDAPDSNSLAARYKQPVPFSDGTRRSTFVYLGASLGVLVAVGAIAYQWYREHDARPARR